MGETGIANDLRSSRRLAGAVILQAIHDLGVGVKPNEDETATRERAQLIQWFVRGDVGAFSLHDCCAVLERDPEQIRTHLDGRIRACHIANIRSRKAQVRAAEQEKLLLADKSKKHRLAAKRRKRRLAAKLSRDVRIN